MFQKSGFEIITKPEPRDIILSYISSTEVEKEELIRIRNQGQAYLIDMKMQ